MKRLACLSLCIVAIACWLPASLMAGPHGVVAGFDPHDGTVLLNELKCAACHESLVGNESNAIELAPLWEKHAPDLSQVGQRVTPQYLRKFLADPHAAKPGTTMPDVLHGKGEGEKKAISEELTHYLASLGGTIDQHSSGSSKAEIHRGEALFHTVGCVACHQPQAPPPLAKLDEDVDAAEAGERSVPKFANAVPLGDLASKTTVEQLAAFLAEPHKVRKSGRMPSLSLQPGEPRAIAAYLLRDQFQADKTAPGTGIGVAVYEGNYQKMPDFGKLTPIYEGESDGINLKQVLADAAEATKKNLKGNFAVRFHGVIDISTDGEYRFWSKSDDGTVLLIDGKKIIDNDGHHPPQEKEGKVTLGRGGHMFELGFTQGGGGFELSTAWQPPGGKRTAIPPGVLLHEAAAMIPLGAIDFKIDQAKATAGKQHFQALGCANCHQTGEVAKRLVHGPALNFVKTAKAGGCLSADASPKAARYDFTAKQREAIAAAVNNMQQGKNKLTPELRVHHQMAANNCYACHQRGEVGGASEQRQPYFVYEKVVDLGDEGRLPPPLHEVGAKLTDAGFDDMMFREHKYRTYMATRMPRFGKENVGHLPELFNQADADKIAKREPKFSPRLVDDGRVLVGKKALSCINCHAWGEHRLPGAEGMDLLESPRRLQPGWFHAWCKEPQTLRPGTRMPTAWPQGQSFFPDIQEGSVDRQIDAIWAYLSVGEKGGYPPGLSPSEGNELTPADEPITFRTFLDGVSAHAILVGFRQRTHVAFDANRVRLVSAWTGPFVTTKESWEGRAGQYAKIVSSHRLNMPEAPPLARLESDAAAWPKDVPKDTGKIGSRRTPEGWRFRGYRFDEGRVPTFLYDAGEVHVAETFTTSFRRESAHIKRTLVLETDAKVDNLYLLIAAGKEIGQDGDRYVAFDGGGSVTATATPKSQPIVRTSDNQQQLLLPVKFADGKATVEIDWLW